jgi:hypothetical protein
MASKPQPETKGELVCWVCQFADCDDHPEEPLLSTGCACCRPGSGGGRAHVSCLASAAAHQERLWYECPTCKQEFTGAVRMGLSRARWELYRNYPEADPERLAALGSLAAALSNSSNSGDCAAARPLLEELVAVARRTRGSDHAFTLDAIGRLGDLLSRVGDDAGAQLLLEEAVAGLRLTLGDEDVATLDTMSQLAAVHGRLNATAKARLLFEEVLVTLRRTAPADPCTFVAIGNLGATIGKAGQHGGASTARGGGCICPAGAWTGAPKYAGTDSVACRDAPQPVSAAVRRPCRRNPGRPGLQAGAQRQGGMRG